VIDTAFAQLEPVLAIKGACLALGRSRATLYRTRRPAQPREPRPRPVPLNALGAQEQATILGALHQARFLDRAPAVVYAVLLDEGTYGMPCLPWSRITGIMRLSRTGGSFGKEGLSGGVPSARA
jgi:hypothetical protein